MSDRKFNILNLSKLGKIWRGVNAAIAVAVFAIMLTLFQFLYLDLVLKRNAETKAKERADYLSNEAAAAVEQYMSKAYSAARNYANNLLIYREKGVKRNIVYRILKSTLEVNDRFLGIWIMMEPDAYDGLDSKFAGDSIHDPRGSFAITYYYYDGEIRQEVNDTNDFYADYYTYPERHLKPVLLPPFLYQYNEKDEKSFYETSLSYPIIDAGNFLGVVGIDIDIADLEKDILSIKTPGKSFICLLSNSGSLITKNCNRVPGDTTQLSFIREFGQIKDSMRSGDLYSIYSTSAEDNKEAVRYFYPITLNSLADPWYLMIEFDRKEIYGRVDRIRRASQHYLLGSLLLLGYLIFNITDRRIKERKMLSYIGELKARKAELNEYKENLERVVEERTLTNKRLNSDLIASNEELNMLNEVLFRQKSELETNLEKLKETQEKLVISEKMASLGVLASGVAHEINNPLHFIKGGVLGIENYAAEHLGESAKELIPFTGAINTGVNRSAEIVLSLGHYSRTSSETSQQCDLNFILENCLVILQSQLRDRIEVRKKYTEECLVAGNEGRLHQAFLNIISNASQAIEGQGTISIETGADNGAGYVRIMDSGSGMSRETMNKIFEPFFTTKEPGKGTGLGLAITQRIIQEHGGKIEYSSEQGKGTVVTVMLPIDKMNQDD